MKSSREIDTRIAQLVFGYELSGQPVNPYSTDMRFAQEVLEKLKMTVIPIQGSEWFVFVGPEDRSGWESPTTVLQFLEAGNFAGCGAASGTDLPALICEAALKAVEKRATEKSTSTETVPSEQPQNNVRPIH